MIKFQAYKILDTATGKMPLDISFSIQSGQLLTLFGKSGAGKTTILRILAGLSRADRSSIEVDDEIWDNSVNNIHLPVQRRSIGFVFQDYALFPNFTVRQNLEFALSREDDKRIVAELLELMELENLQHRKPGYLSGGQKQRVALARALARKPKVLLLDEPLSALDDEMRFKLQDYLFRAHQLYKQTTLFVSHHLPEIFRLSDRVMVLEEGKVVREGKPAEVFSENKTSDRFEVTGEVIEISKNDIVFLVSILVLNNIVKIVATETEVKKLKVGAQVRVASKLFNPVIELIG